MSIQNRRTPQWLFDLLNKKFGPFVLDAAADPNNALCQEYYTESNSGIANPWHDVTFCNPPFKNMLPWIKKAHMEATAGGVRSVMICPQFGSQSWAHDYARLWSIYVPDRRISYDLPDGKPTDAADRDTTIMVFGPGHENPSLTQFRVIPLALPND